MAQVSRQSQSQPQVEDGFLIALAKSGDPTAYARVRDDFLKLRYVEDPTVVIDELVGLANEPARAKLKRRSFPPP